MIGSLKLRPPCASRINPDGFFPGNLLQVDKMMIAKFLVKTRCNITTLTRKVLQIES